MTGLVYKEPVVLCRLGSGTWKIGLKQVNKGEITTIKRLGRWLFTPVKGECSRHQLRRCFKCNLTKLTTKSSADWQCRYLLRTSVVNAAWPGGMVMWFFSHMASLVRDLACFLVLLCPVGLLPLSPPYFFHCFSVWEVPGHLARDLSAELQGSPAIQVQLGPGAGWLAGFPWKPLDISGNQLPFCDLVGDCGNLTLNNFLI